MKENNIELRILSWVKNKKTKVKSCPFWVKQSADFHKLRDEKRESY